MEDPQSENAEQVLLAPDHPLLEKFQKALKEHLLFQINRTKDEIFDYETETKKKNEERQVLGVQTYEAQQLVCQQQKTLEDVIKQLQTVTAANEAIEDELKEHRSTLKELRDKYVNSEKLNRELQNEIEAVNYLNTQMTHWEQKIESQITVNKRIVSKTKQDNHQSLQNKKDQDMLIYALNREIWKFEGEIDTLAIQVQVKEDEMEELEQSVALGNTNIDAIQAEIRCLVHSWNSVVVAIGHRDKGLTCLNVEYFRLQEKLKKMASEIEQIKKLTKKELIDNERFTMLRDRVLNDIKKCSTQTEEEVTKKDTVEQELYRLQAILEQTEKDIESVKHKNQHKEQALLFITKQFDKIANKKFEMEEKLFKFLDNQLSSDKLTKNLAKTLDCLRGKRLDVEIKLKEVENKLALLSSQIQAQRFSNDQNSQLLDEIQKQQAELHKEADALQTEKDKNELLFRKREREVSVLMKKLEKLNEKSDDVVSPLDLRRIELDKHIEETQEAIKKLQCFWLREQKNLLTVSNERQGQIHQMNLLKKQTLILEQKNLKTNYELESYRKNEERVLHNINNLQNKGTILCDEIFKKRNQKTKLDRNNILVQTDYETRLKDAELAVLQVEAEIVDIESDKVSLSEDLMELNREALEWEKKLQLAKETVNKMRQERNEGGEVGSMQLEIHKMEVIYGQMKKAQEKLIKDLNYCIARRDGIYFTAEARVKKEQASKRKIEERTRVVYIRKMDNIRNKIKQTENEIKNIEEKKKMVKYETSLRTHGTREAEEKITVLTHYSQDLREDLETSKTNRQFNFELLLIQQKKLTLYNDLLLLRKPFVMYKTADQLLTENKKQKELNRKLEIIVDNLTTDYPDKEYELDRLNNSLKIGSLNFG